MLSTENTNVTNEELNNEQTEVQVAEAQSGQEVVMKEKKKFDLKAFGKRVAIGTGAAAGAVGVFVIGYLTGKHSVDGSDQSEAPVDDVVSTETAAE